MLMVVVIIQTREDYIYATIDQTLDNTTTEYIGAEIAILVCCIIFLFFLIVEFLILFTGLSVFFDKANIV